MDDEVWKRIPHAPAHEASSLGRIRSRINPDPLVLKQFWRYKNRKDKRAYKVVCIFTGDGTRRRANLSVERAVCAAFHGPPPTKRHRVLHLDKNDENMAASNLKWVTEGEYQEYHNPPGRESCVYCDRPLPVTRKQRVCWKCSMSYHEARKRGKTKEWRAKRAKSGPSLTRLSGKGYPDRAVPVLLAYLFAENPPLWRECAEKLDISVHRWTEWVRYFRKEHGMGKTSTAERIARTKKSYARGITRRQQKPARKAPRPQLPHYSKRMKRIVANTFQDNDVTVRDIARELGVDERTVYRWVKQYGKGKQK